jgi:hypothetical protein
LCSISPQVIGSAQLEVSSRASERVQWLAGDFFLDPLPEADLFATSRILHDWRHDWREDKIDALLTKIYRRLRKRRHPSRRKVAAQRAPQWIPASWAPPWSAKWAMAIVL